MWCGIRADRTYFVAACRSKFSGGTADILPAERAKASFDHDTMTGLIDGSKKVTRKRRWIYYSYSKLTGPMSDARKYVSVDQRRSLRTCIDCEPKAPPATCTWVQLRIFNDNIIIAIER